MKVVINRVRSFQVDNRGILVESLVFIFIYAILLGVLPQDAPVRAFVENLAIIISSLTAAILVFIALPSLKTATRPAWIMLTLTLLTWAMATEIPRQSVKMKAMAPMWPASLPPYAITA